MSDNPMETGAHLDRINPSDPPAAKIPDHVVDAAKTVVDWYAAQGAPLPTFAAPDHPEGMRWLYRLTRKSFINGAMIQPGAHLWLLPHEVGPQHEILDQPEPMAAAEPAPEVHPDDQQVTVSRGEYDRAVEMRAQQIADDRRHQEAAEAAAAEPPPAEPAEPAPETGSGEPAAPTETTA